MRKWLVILIIVIIGVIGYNYVYQNHRDISTEAVEFEMSADNLHLEFQKNLKTSEAKFLNKTLTVSGNVSEMNKMDFTLNNKIFCQINDGLKSPIDTYQYIKVKGRVIGYDELLEQVKLDQCTLIEY